MPPRYRAISGQETTAVTMCFSMCKGRKRRGTQEKIDLRSEYLPQPSCRACATRQRCARPQTDTCCRLNVGYGQYGNRLFLDPSPAICSRYLRLQHFPHGGTFTSTAPRCYFRLFDLQKNLVYKMTTLLTILSRTCHVFTMPGFPTAYRRQASRAARAL